MKAGKLKALGVTASKRSVAAPEVATMTEQGVADCVVDSWYGAFVPVGTPPAVIAKLNAAAVDAMSDARVRQRLNDVGHELPPREQLTPHALLAYHKAEIEKWTPIIRAANIKLQ